MRVLFVTAYYPPCQHGWGYMRICEQIADGLSDRGHAVAVLTSTYRHGSEFKPYRVSRLLAIDPDWRLPQSAAQQFFFGRRAREQAAVRVMCQQVQEFKPDVIFIWHAHGLPRALLHQAENLAGVHTTYYFANYLPELPDEYIPYWQSLPTGRAGRWIKGALAQVALAILAREGKPIPLRYEHSVSVSQYVRLRLMERGLIGQDAVVIPNGVDVSEFYADARTFGDGREVRCVAAGRIVPEKGIHTLLRAFGLLHQRRQLRCVQLNIIGDGPGDYRRELAQIIDECNLQGFVHFRAPVAIEEMPAIYAQHDVLMLPSEWHEPLSCTMLEAMAAGLLVIGTTTGGSGEVLWHEKTGLVFEAGDPESLAQQITTLLSDPALARRLAAAGQREVEQSFNIQRSVERTEAYLEALVASRREVSSDGIKT